MSKHLFLGLAVLLLFGATSCEVEEVSLVDISKVELNRVEKDRIYLDVTAILDNPNGFDINVTDSDLDLSLAGVDIGKTRLDSLLTLEKRTQGSYEMKIVAEGKNMNTKLLPVFLSTALSGKVDVHLRGTISGKVFMIKRNVKVDIHEEVKFRNDS